MQPERQRSIHDYGGPVLLVCLLAAAVFAFVVFRPFLTIFILAAVLAILAQPVFRFFLRRLGKRRSLAAIITVLAVVFFVIAPVILLFSLLVNESLQAYQLVEKKISTGALDQKFFAWLSKQQKRYLPKLSVDLSDLSKSAAGLAGRVSNTIIGMAKDVLQGLSSAMWQFVLMLVALFYFLRDGDRVVKYAMHLAPLPSSLEREITSCFQDVSRSAFFGTFLTALIQGFLGGIGFLIVGLPPVVWGVVMAFFSMVPLVGTAMVWAPASIVLFAMGKVVGGIFLICWGVLVVGASDNFLRPMLMRGKHELHPMLIFFSLLGGLAAFGFLGVILGPLSVMLLIALLRAYEEAARPVLEEMDRR
ncbi:MAG: AI-2E family transporter [Thermodesulfobacteriota bacterium]